MLETPLHVQVLPLYTPPLAHLLRSAPSRLFRCGDVERCHGVRQRCPLPRFVLCSFRVDVELRCRRSNISADDAEVPCNIDWKDVQVYIDDVVITSKKGTTLIEDLKETFDNLDKFCLKLNPTKCSFGVPVENFSGS
ncbi:hypothetical protein QYE76_057596 [Lolium multiflorum]|uniref:Reverse transcriptase domain-containing protein n=1 Tax=Lolium multiflorum TaxID=4521 RepID=A0AAD8T432_LOLMU|nr:hypothetical protein QYE76_057596 [Lolium multiflorum]